MNTIYSLADEYEQLCNRLREIIRESKYRVRAFIDELDMADSTFYEKLERGSWKPHELKKIAPMLEAKRVHREEAKKKR